MGPGPGQTLCGPLAPTPDTPPCGGRGGLPLPSHPCRISLYRTIFKMEAKTQYTSDRHAHTCTRAPAPNRGRTSAALREHHGMHTEPRLARRAGQRPALVLTVHSSSLPTALLAARGRAVQGWGGEGSASLQVPQGWGEGWGRPRPQVPEG